MRILILVVGHLDTTLAPVGRQGVIVLVREGERAIVFERHVVNVDWRCLVLGSLVVNLNRRRLLDRRRLLGFGQRLGRTGGGLVALIELDAILVDVKIGERLDVVEHHHTAARAFERAHVVDQARGAAEQEVPRSLFNDDLSLGEDKLASRKVALGNGANKGVLVVLLVAVQAGLEVLDKDHAAVDCKPRASPSLEQFLSKARVSGGLGGNRWAHLVLHEDVEAQQRLLPLLGIHPLKDQRVCHPQQARLGPHPFCLRKVL